MSDSGRAAQLEQSRLLSITFVQSDGGNVSGLLDRYSDPVCGCTLSTTFNGRLHGDVIEGAFSSLHLQEGRITNGTWKVTRHSSRPTASDVSRSSTHEAEMRRQEHIREKSHHTVTE